MPSGERVTRAELDDALAIVLADILLRSLRADLEREAAAAPHAGEDVARPAGARVASRRARKVAA